MKLFNIQTAVPLTCFVFGFILLRKEVPMMKTESTTMELAAFKKQFRKLILDPFGTITVMHRGLPFLRIQDLRKKALVESVKAHLGPHPTPEQIEQYTQHVKEAFAEGATRRRRKSTKVPK
jgi:hypothetical protein